MPKFVIRRTTEWTPSRDKPPGVGAKWSDDLAGSGCWTIVLASLDELLALAKAVGVDLVVKPESMLDSMLPEIEIYDGYRE
jgi:hypothetical protein